MSDCRPSSVNPWSTLASQTSLYLPEASTIALVAFNQGVAEGTTTHPENLDGLNVALGG